MEKYKLILPLVINNHEYVKGCVFKLKAITVLDGALLIKAIFPHVRSQIIEGEMEEILPEAILNHCESIITKYKEGDLIDVEKVMKLTGYSKHTIYKMTSTNQIPFIKRSGRRKLFFSKKAVIEWINEKQSVRT